MAGTFWRHIRNQQWYQKLATVEMLSDSVEKHVLYKQCYWGPYPFGQLWLRPESEWTPSRFEAGVAPKSVQMFAHLDNTKNKYAFIYEPKTITVYGLANMAGSAEEHLVFKMNDKLLVHPARYMKHYLDGLILDRKQIVTDADVYLKR